MVKRKVSIKVIMNLFLNHIGPAIISSLTIVAGIVFDRRGEALSVFHWIVMMLTMVYIGYKIATFFKIIHYLKYANIKKAQRVSYEKLHKKHFGLVWYKYKYEYIDEKKKVHQSKLITVTPWKKEYSSDRRVLFLLKTPDKSIILTHKYRNFVISMSHVYMK